MKKLKLQYQNPETYFGIKREWKYYPFLRSWIHKHFSTKQEKGYYFLHKFEYKDYPLRLRSARGKQLATPWDDYPIMTYKLGKSWKHNSRRKNQYFRQS
ncbi:hypothetical protein [Providencia rettgeri]